MKIPAALDGDVRVTLRVGAKYEKEAAMTKWGPLWNLPFSCSRRWQPPRPQHHNGRIAGICIRALPDGNMKPVTSFT